MNKSLIQLLCFCLLNVLPFQHAMAQNKIHVTGELKALKTDSYTPPRVRGVWQYTIAFMAEDGAVVKPGQPVLMFKTDAIQTKLVNAKGKLAIKQSEITNKKVNRTESYEKKSIFIEEKKMILDKARRKAELPQSLLAKNEYQENQLNAALATKEYQAALMDLKLAKQKAQTEEKILKAEIIKLKADISQYSSAISSMRMFSTSEGIVIHKSAWNGNKFAIGDSVWGGQRVIEVASLSQIIAKLEIPENKIKHVTTNQLVTVKLDSLPDKEFKGSIKSLSQVVRIKSKNQPSKLLEAIVYFDTVDTEVMRPGMRLSADIKTGDMR